MRNLHYKIRICQKSHNTVTITVYVWTGVRNLIKQTLLNHYFQVYDGINRTYETVVGLCTYTCQNGVLANAGTMPTDTADRHMALLGLLTCNSDK